MDTNKKTPIFKVKHSMNDKNDAFMEIFDDIISIHSFLGEIMDIPISDKNLQVQICKFRKFTNKKAKDIKRKLKILF